MECEKFAEDRSEGESSLPVRGTVNAFGVARVAEDVLIVVLVLSVRGRHFAAWTIVWFRDGVGRVHEGECPRLHRV